MGRGRSIGTVLLVVCACLSAVSLAVAVNVATGGSLPHWLDGYRQFAWPAVALLTLATIAITLAQTLGPMRGDVLVKSSGKVSNLPPRNPRFAGRDDLLHLMVEGFRRANAPPAASNRLTAGTPLFALCGMPGLGKTQTALEFAHRVATERAIRWWIPAENPADLLSSILDLGVALNPDVQREEMSPDRVMSTLSGRSDWLLVFDNAESPAAIERYLPAGDGWVLVTSRSHSWGALGEPYELQTFSDFDAVAFLASRLRRRDPNLVKLAHALGNLPLALDQAAAYIEKTRISIRKYLSLLDKNVEPLLSRGDAAFYANRADVALRLALDRVRHRSRPAAQLLEILAFFGAEDIPESMFANDPDLLPEELQGVYSDDLIHTDTVGELIDSSLVRVSQSGFSVHRLTQAGVRAQLSLEDRIARIKVALEVVYAALGGPHPASVLAHITWDGIESHAIIVAEFAEPHSSLHREACAVLYRVGQNFEAMAEESRLARPILEKALALAEKSFGERSPESAAILATLSCLSSKFNDKVEAVEYARRAVSIVRETGRAAFGDSPHRFLEVFETSMDQ